MSIVDPSPRSLEDKKDIDLDVCPDTEEMKYENQDHCDAVLQPVSSSFSKNLTKKKTTTENKTGLVKH